LFAVTISNDAPADFIIGITPVTWTATDANGRVSTGIQQVTVNVVSIIPAVTLNNGSTVDLTAPIGETVFQVAGAPAPLVMPAGIAFPFGILAYSVTSPLAGNVMMTLAFSTPLPPVFTLYKVDNAGVVTAMPASSWTKSGANTIQLTLTDGGAFDLDGLQNGIIVDPIAIGVDTQVPVITLTGANPITVAQGGTFTDPGTSVTDNVDTGLVAIVTGAVDAATVGTYTLTYNASDLTGNAAVALIRTVNVTDQTNPVVIPPANITVIATSANGTTKTDAAIAVFLNSATAADNVGVVGAVANNAPAMLPVGTTTVIFTAVDAAGNTGTAIATITVSAYVIPDTTKPVIAVNGANPATVEAGQIYTDALATVTDNVDPTNALLAGVSLVNTAAVGSYTVTYNASDVAGNAAVPVVRTVHVVDTTNPVLTLPANAVANATGVRTTVAIGTATATDLFAVTITSNAPADFPIGITPVTWTATDANGRVSTGVQQVTVNAVADMIKPVLIMTGGNVTVVQGQIYTDAGATATDNIDGNITANIAVNNLVNASVIGAYTVTYNVSDAAGNNAAQLTRTVNVVADQPPLITLLGASPITLVQGAVYNDSGATAFDDVDGNVTANIAVANLVNTAVVATYTVTYNVSDAAGNAAIQLVRTVNVIPVGGAANPGEAVQVPLTGSAASVDVHAVGQSISNFSATAVSGTPPAGVSVPLGVLSYTTTVPVGVTSQTVNLSFSSALPANFVLYKVDNAGIYSIIPNGTGVDQWTQVDATTIDLTLSDGGQFDLDGVTNGIIIDPVAVGVPPAPVAVAAPASSGGGGGCSINSSATFDPAMLVLLLFALIGLARRRH